MEYKVVGKTVPAVEITLQRGETMFTQSGGMFWMSDGISMNTNTRGGFMKGLGRMFAGESMFMAHYTAEMDNAQVAFAANVAGSLIPIDVDLIPGMIIQKRAFLCAQDTVQLETVFNKKASVGFFGGEGFIMQQLRGSGMAFLEVDGDLVQRDLQPGEVIKVDTGNLVGFSPSVKYEIETVKGLGNILVGGEGLFHAKLVGPGKVLMQTMNFAEFCGNIASALPSSNG
jgi:uncharacterized protein (TIGR00266 family)